jgi:hypothetical protein
VTFVLKILAFIVLVLAAVAVTIAAFVLIVWVLVWNLTDIQNVGINFWNIFWIALAALALLGGTTKAASS